MKRTNSFLIFLILIFLDIKISFSKDYIIDKVEITGNQRIPSSYITNITNKFFNEKITDEEINLITKDLFKSDFFEDIRKIVVQHQDQLSFEILRNEQIIFFNIKPEILNSKDLETKSFKIGIIASSPVLIKHDLISSINYGLKDTISITYEWIKGFVKLVSFNVDKKDIAGPIGIAKISGNAISLGVPNFLFLMALLSINLGLINLLPIPALDGGYIVMYSIEFILGRPINQKIQFKLIQIGVIFLMLLMIVITFFDIQKLFV